MLALKVLLFTVCVPGTVAVLVPYAILASGSGLRVPALGVLQYAAAILLLVGLAIYTWCVSDFARAGRGTPAPIDPPKALVVRGLYRVTRNPMYVGVLCVLLGEAAFFSSFRLLVYALAVFAAFQTFVVAYEEPTLTRTFGEAYEQYRRTVPRWFL